MSHEILTKKVGAVVLYDAACPLCCTLAELMGRRAQGSLRFESWQTYWHGPSDEHEEKVLGEDARRPMEPPDRLHIVVEGQGEEQQQMYGGVEAWERIVGLHPDFHALRWMAVRLGLTRELATVTQSTVTFLRRLCTRCPR